MQNMLNALVGDTVLNVLLIIGLILIGVFTLVALIYWFSVVMRRRNNARESAVAHAHSSDTIKHDQTASTFGFEKRNDEITKKDDKSISTTKTDSKDAFSDFTRNDIQQRNAGQDARPGQPGAPRPGQPGGPTQPGQRPANRNFFDSLDKNEGNDAFPRRPGQQPGQPVRPTDPRDPRNQANPWGTQTTPAQQRPASANTNPWQQADNSFVPTTATQKDAWGRPVQDNRMVPATVGAHNQTQYVDKSAHDKIDRVLAHLEEQSKYNQYHRGQMGMNERILPQLAWEENPEVARMRAEMDILRKQVEQDAQEKREARRQAAYEAERRQYNDALKQMQAKNDDTIAKMQAEMMELITQMKKEDKQADDYPYLTARRDEQQERIDREKEEVSMLKRELEKQVAEMERDRAEQIASFKAMRDAFVAEQKAEREKIAQELKEREEIQRKAEQARREQEEKERKEREEARKKAEFDAEMARQRAELDKMRKDIEDERAKTIAAINGERAKFEEEKKQSIKKTEEDDTDTTFDAFSPEVEAIKIEADELAKQNEDLRIKLEIALVEKERADRQQVELKDAIVVEREKIMREAEERVRVETDKEMEEELIRKNEELEEKLAEKSAELEEEVARKNEVIEAERAKMQEQIKREYEENEKRLSEKYLQLREELQRESRELAEKSEEVRAEMEALKAATESVQEDKVHAKQEFELELEVERAKLKEEKARLDQKLQEEKRMIEERLTAQLSEKLEEERRELEQKIKSSDKELIAELRELEKQLESKDKQIIKLQESAVATDDSKLEELKKELEQEREKLRDQVAREHEEKEKALVAKHEEREVELAQKERQIVERATELERKEQHILSEETRILTEAKEVHHLITERAYTTEERNKILLDYRSKLEELQQRLRENEKAIRGNNKEFVPLRRIRDTLERDLKLLRKREAIVAKQQVIIYGVNNITNLDPERVKKLEIDVKQLTGLQQSVANCQDIMHKNRDRFPTLENLDKVLKGQNRQLVSDIEEYRTAIEFFENAEKESQAK